MAEFKTGEIWGLGTTSTTGKALTASFEASNGDPIVLHGPVDLVCTAFVQVDPADSIELRFDFPIGDELVWTMPGLTDTGEVAKFTSRVWQLEDGAVGSYSFSIQIPWACTFRLMAKGTGVGAGTLLRIVAEARSLGDGGGGGGGALAAAGGSTGAINGAYDDVTGTVLTSEQAGPETVLRGETLFDVTGGADDTYDYYVEHDEFHTFLIHYQPGGAGTKTLTVWASAQDDGTPIASRQYVDVTASVFSSPSFTTESFLRDSGGDLRDAKSLRFRVVVSGGGGAANWKGYYKASY